MPVAANLEEAAAFAMQNSFVVFASVNTLRNQLGLWLQALANTPLDAKNEAQRTVLNWVPISRPLESGLPTVKADEQTTDVNMVGTCLFRMCSAAQFAESNGRITGAQAAAILASYNTIWT